MKRNYKWTIRWSLLTIPLFFVAVFFMGGGHGTYIPAMFLFPFGLISTVMFDRITLPFLVLGIIQYPIYGFIVDKTRESNNSRVFIPILILAHVLLVVILITLKGEN